MVVARDCYGPFVADCDQFTKTVDPNRRLSYEAIKANTKLIASAPTLLEERDRFRESLESLREMIWSKDIPSPTTPEYREWHENCQKFMRHIDAALESTKGEG